MPRPYCKESIQLVTQDKRANYALVGGALNAARFRAVRRITVTRRHTNDQQPTLSRRRLIGSLGVGAAGALAMGSSIANAEVPDSELATVVNAPQTFGRMFPNLPPFAQPTEAVKAALRELGKPGGIMDARDPLDRGPIQLIMDPRSQHGEPRQPEPHGRHDVPRPVPRPRHDLRHDVAAGRADPAGDRRPTPAPRRSTWTRSTAAAPPAARSSTPVRPGQAAHRVRRPVRGRAARRQRHGDHRRPAQRRERRHLRPAVRVHPVPQPGRRPGARGQGVPDRPRSVHRGPADAHLALPVDHRQRVPAADHRPGHGQPDPHATAGGSTARRPGQRSSRSSSRVPPTGSATAWCARRTG